MWIVRWNISGCVTELITLEKLVMGAYQLVELRLAKYETLGREPFPGGSIEDFMAYFQRHNLRFAAASPAHRSAYHRIFTMMVRYYMDVKMAVNLEQQLDWELSEDRAARFVEGYREGVGAPFLRQISLSASNRRPANFRPRWAASRQTTRSDKPSCVPVPPSRCLVRPAIDY